MKNLTSSSTDSTHYLNMPCSSHPNSRNSSLCPLPLKTQRPKKLTKQDVCPSLKFPLKKQASLGKLGNRTKENNILPAKSELFQKKNINFLKSKTIADKKEFKIKQGNFYYYISDIQKDMKNLGQQKEGTFLSHIIFSMCIFKSYQSISLPDPSLKFPTTKIQNYQKSKRKLVIFDLDETLVHGMDACSALFKLRNDYQDCHKVVLKQESNTNCQSQKTQMKMQLNFGKEQQNFSIQFEEMLPPSKQLMKIKKRDQTVEFLVNVRPYAKEVLGRLAQYFCLAVFTASHQNYAAQIVKILDPNQQFFSFVLDRRYCSQVKCGQPGQVGDGVFSMHVKDLRVLDKFDPLNMVLVDNCCMSYLLQPQNGIPIIPFVDDAGDEELLKLESFLLNSILPCRDVRPLIQQRFQVSEYPKYKSVKDLVERIVRTIENDGV